MFPFGSGAKRLTRFTLFNHGRLRAIFTIMIKSFSELTPTIDKGLAVLGATISAALGIADVSTTVGIMVGITTLCMIIPRAILNWDELRESRKRNRESKATSKNGNGSR